VNAVELPFEPENSVLGTGNSRLLGKGTVGSLRARVGVGGTLEHQGENMVTVELGLRRDLGEKAGFTEEGSLSGKGNRRAIDKKEPNNLPMVRKFSWKKMGGGQMGREKVGKGAL